MAPLAGGINYKQRQTRLLHNFFGVADELRRNCFSAGIAMAEILCLRLLRRAAGKKQNGDMWRCGRQVLFFTRISLKCLKNSVGRQTIGLYFPVSAAGVCGCWPKEKVQLGTFFY